MKIIGLTGGTGAGKTTALKYLESLGARVIDCDALYHELLDSSAGMKAELGRRFPGAANDGVVDRKKLGEYVFGNPEALDELNEITHKYVRLEVERIINEEKSAGRAILAIDAILLLETGAESLCNRVIGVIAPEGRRVSRIMERDGIEEAYALSRIRAQKPDSYYIDNCDMILENDYEDIESFYELCAEFIGDLLSDISKEEEY